MPVNGTTLAVTISTNSTSTQDILMQSAGAITAAIVFSIIVILGIILALVVKFHKPSHGLMNAAAASQSSRHTRTTTAGLHRLNGTAAASSTRRHNAAYSGGAAAACEPARYITPYGLPHGNGSLSRPGGLLDGLVVTERTQAAHWQPQQQQRWPRVPARVPAAGLPRLGARPSVDMDDLPTISRFDDPGWNSSRRCLCDEDEEAARGGGGARGGSATDEVSFEMSTVNTIEDLLPPDYPH